MQTTQIVAAGTDWRILSPIDLFDWPEANAKNEILIAYHGSSANVGDVD